MGFSTAHKKSTLTHPHTHSSNEQKNHSNRVHCTLVDVISYWHWYWPKKERKPPKQFTFCLPLVYHTRHFLFFFYFPLFFV